MTLTKKEVTRKKSIKYDIDGLTLKELKKYAYELEDRYGPDAKISVEREWDYDEYTSEVYVTWKALETDKELKKRKLEQERIEELQRKQYEQLKKKFENS